MAYYSLAMMYSEGKGVEKSLSEALGYARHAIVKKEQRSQNRWKGKFWRNYKNRTVFSWFLINSRILLGDDERKVSGKRKEGRKSSA